MHYGGEQASQLAFGCVMFLAMYEETSRFGLFLCLNARMKVVIFDGRSSYVAAVES
jgi:hypothetical protein